jgi:hypothetical protein
VTAGVRDTDLAVASHSRLVYRNAVEGLRAAFDAGYNRDRQLLDLRVTQQYPNKKIDYPSVVVEYSPQRVVAAGVGHIEWFPDPRGRLRKWKHSRFEGTLALHVYALSTLDRDIISDAVAEVIRFGSLDAQLNRFYEVIYPDDESLADGALPGEDYDWRMFGQLMLDSDQLMATGNSATIAPWSPEDLLVYSGGWTMNLHGGYYNSVPTQDWSRVKTVRITAFTEDGLAPPIGAEFSWDTTEDSAIVRGTGVVGGGDSFTDVP